jgi:hypothetical protein
MPLCLEEPFEMENRISRAAPSVSLFLRLTNSCLYLESSVKGRLVGLRTIGHLRSLHQIQAFTRVQADVESPEAIDGHDSPADRTDCIFGDLVALHVLLHVFQPQSSGTTVVDAPNVAIQVIFSSEGFQTDFAGGLIARLCLVMGTHLSESPVKLSLLLTPSNAEAQLTLASADAAAASADGGNNSLTVFERMYFQNILSRRTG